MTKLRDIFPDLDAMRVRAAARPPVTAAEVCARWPETLRDLAAVEAAERSPFTPGTVVLIDDELGAWRVVDVSDTPCACCGGPSVDTLHRVTGRGALYHVCAARLHRAMPPSFCQICGVDTVPPAAYCPACDAVLATGGVE